MRLTLRTLLAYMDDILEPSDQQELAQKIESSEFATDLIHRTRDTMRRLRLSAPQALGSGLGLDPNTVAEYLDNTLTPDNVADLERICLESDVHLAEVASCHHILTMVLAEPAEIDSRSRQRMYTIAGELEKRKQLRTDTAHPARDAVTAAAVVDAPEDAAPEVPSSVASSTIVEVPDYLRASRWSPLGIGAGVAAVAAGIALLVFLGRGMFDDSPDVLAVRDANPPSSSPPTDESDESLDSPVNAAGAGDSDAAPTNIQEGQEQDGQDTLEQPQVEVPPLADAAETQPPLAIPPASEPLASTPVEPSATVDIPPSEAPLSTQTQMPAIPPDDPAPAGSDPGAAVAATNEGTGGVNAQPAEGLAAANSQPAPPPPAMENNVSPAATLDPPTPGEPATTGLATTERPDAAAVAAAESTGEAVQPPPATELGTFWADRNVLLRYDPGSANWLPLATGSAIQVGDQLLSLPTFRPTVALRHGIGVKLVGATSVQLFDHLPQEQLPDANAPQAPALAITYGRVELINSVEADNPLHVIIGPSAGTIRMGPGAVVAFGVERKWVPGNDPLTTPSPIEATAYAPNGNVTWIVADQAHPIEKAAEWAIGPGLPVQLVTPGDQSVWLEDEPLDRLERSAAEQIRERLSDPQYPASMVLLDVSNSRRREERALATRCAVYVGEFAPFVRALGDSDQRSSWELHIQTLREALALSPASAAKVRRALFEQRGDLAASDMFEMLCGYSLEEIGMTPQERQLGALDRLIGFLESDSLDYRVLANHNLREITGKNLLPNPTADPDERARGVRRWRQRLEAGELEPLASYGW